MAERSEHNRPLSFFLVLALVFLLMGGLVSAGAPLSHRSVVQAAPAQQNLPIVSFVQSSDSIIEPDDDDEEEITISVKISRAPASGEEVTVSYSTANGSATAGVDYEAASGQLTFPVGSTSVQEFDVTIFGNNTDQPNRTFIVFLTNPVNATVGVPSSTTITIVDNDVAAPTNTPTATPGGPVFLDDYEPNNDFSQAYTTAADASRLTNVSIWPKGDEDFFAFFAKKGSTYEVFTTDVGAGLDTLLRVYDPEGNKIAENDDVDVPGRRSQVQINARENGIYFARITDKDPTDSTNKAYSFGVNEIVPPTATPTSTRVGQLDVCEPNNTVGTACLIGPGEVRSSMNFVPPAGTGTDNDFYRMPVKPGVLYTCETTNLSAANDTNIIFLDQNGNDLNPPKGNDDRAPGDPSSLLSWYSTYQGDLIILVGPVNPPPYEESPLFTYDLTCTSVAATPTPPPTATVAFVPPASGGPGGPGGAFVPSPTPVVFPTFPPTPTAIDFANLAPTRLPPPVIVFVPLPTATPIAGAQQTTSVQVTVYYDANRNFTPELNEGVSDVAVELYDNASGSLLAFGYTNDAGMIRFDGITSSGPVRIEVAFLNYSQVVSGASANILLRIEPRPLPSAIP